MRPLSILFAAVTCLSVLTATSNSQTIARFLSENGGAFDNDTSDYDILRRAVATADLVSALQNRDAELTLFAPNDLAFTRLARDLGYTGPRDEQAVWNFLVQALTGLGDGDPIGPLTNVLLYHVTPRNIDIAEFIQSDQIITLLDGESFRVAGFVRMIDNDPDSNNARLFSPLNVKYSNGTVHGISRVLRPLDL